MAEPKDLLKYLELFQEDEHGEWEFSPDHAGTKDDPIPVPNVSYSYVAIEFERDVYAIESNCPELGIHDYASILEKNGLEWSAENLGGADVTELDEQCILAMCLAIIRADRFSEGIVLEFLKEGHIQKWLERLQEIIK